MLFEAILLGIVQGLTEYFPVSSTAHLIIVAWMFNFSDAVSTLSFDVALHAGTLLAVVAYFLKDWIEMLKRKRKLLSLILIATIPAGCAGYFFNDFVEHSLRSPLVISIALITISSVMWISERYQKSRDVDAMGSFDSFFIGVAQALALIPGVSRSGITISAGMLRNLNREAATRFSFLMSTPIIAGAVVLHLSRMVGTETPYNMNAILAGIASSAVSGFFAIQFLMNFFKKHTLHTFIYYRIVLALIIVLGLWLKG